MAPFTFSLQDVLDHRKRVEEDAQKKIAAIRIRLEECEGAIERLEKKRKETNTELYDKTAQAPLRETERKIYDNYLWAAAKEIENLTEAKTALLSELDRARQDLIEAMRQREIIDEVRKAEYAQYQKSENLEERKFYDDLAQRTWRQGKSESFLQVEGSED